MSDTYYTDMDPRNPPVPPPRPPPTAPRPGSGKRSNYLNSRQAHSEEQYEVDDYVDPDTDWRGPNLSSSMRQQSLPSSRPPPPIFPPPPTELPPSPPGRGPPALPPPRHSAKPLSPSHSNPPPPLPPMNPNRVKHLTSPAPPLPSSRHRSSSPVTDDVYTAVDYGPDGQELPLPGAEDCDTSNGVGLVKFTNDFQRRFPTMMEVTCGYLNTGEDCSMTEGERFLIHFLKKSKVVVMQDEQGERLNVPLNSPFEFGLLHDPNKNEKEAHSGFLFKAARDLMLSRILPKVVRARKGFRGISPEHCIEVNDLLLVKELVQKEGELRYLKCIKVATGEERHLHDNCIGHFSTTPYDVRMMLPDIIKHFQLPLKAVFYTNTDIEEEIPSHLISSTVTISSWRTEESLVATPLPEDEEEEDLSAALDPASVQINEIPLNYDIKVRHVATRPMQTDQLLKTTEELYNNFDPASVYPYLPKYSLVQYMIWKATRKDNPMAGVELVPPPPIAEQQALIAKQSPVMSAESLSEIVRLQVRVARLEADRGQQHQDGDTPHYYQMGSPTSLSSLQDQISVIKSELKQYQQQMSRLESTVIDLKQKLSTRTAVHSPAKKQTDAGINRIFLASLDLIQVQTLLDALQLQQYKLKFQEEMVSGAILMDVDEDILKNELDVSSKLHRIRLMKLITGEYSAERILKGENPYGSIRIRN